MSVVDTDIIAIDAATATSLLSAVQAPGIGQTAPIEGPTLPQRTSSVRIAPSRSPTTVIQPATVQNDQVAFSAPATNLSMEAARNLLVNQATNVAAAAVDEAEAVNAYAMPNTNRSIRELLESFEYYDNSEAVRRYDTFLNIFSAYAPIPDSVQQENGDLTLREMENRLYQSIGANRPGVIDREVREGIGRAIDRWLAGRGVFWPEMLGYPSGDGFRFAPLSEEAANARRSGTVLSSFQRERIAEYLRLMAGLVPADFMFYDPTGLGPLSLVERRDFLRIIDILLEEAASETRATELAYAFAEDGSLDFAAMEREARDLERRMLELQRYDLSSYYGAMMNAIRQYGAGIVSAVFG